MQIEINQLRQQVRALKKMIGAIFGLMIAGWLVVFIGVRGTTEIVGQAGEFDTITTRKLVIESHAGDPWLVAEESLVEPDMPERGGNQFLRIGRDASNFNCWLDARGGLQMWMKDAYDHERINLTVRGGPNDMASIKLWHPEPNAEAAFIAFSCNASCREMLERGEHVID